ncbi:prephenate dehydrogenase [Sporomusa acidovorans]|uniref:Cyclohexadienyl dehydrogenase n=1 Tax=Sporomusa acidovorans (strain ATCC 49682 / DSM 3132 / Mol) TaxID=1123286 RepID=A0ABZ3J443_SPOA4|nr:prephenate dehydrogenase [Sporomusa acidovorans]OZC15523.1 prephenate dehydrogenase [Sporomusa acidovorans DSM 3132]SDE17041.1 prephenate dehydrogenase [Sporomusa acidovorans]
MRPAVKQIAIIGMGLIGGSLGLAIKAAQGSNIEIVGIDTNKLALTIAKQCGAADLITTDYKTGVENADIVFLCTPVLQIAAHISEIAFHVKKGAILTDTGSTKTYLMEKIAAVLPREVHYIPGHPMAGREKSGIEAAECTLFRDKWYIVIPDAKVDSRAMETLCQVISWTGARITQMNAAQHDRCTALISHMPHIGAAALVTLLQYSEDQETSIKLAGGGFRDTTRIASSNADMWADICMTNTEPIADSLDKFSQIISDVAEKIRQKDRNSIHAFFANAKARRDALLRLEQQFSE